MNQILFFTDEDVYGAVAIGLRQAGLDALSTPDAGRLGESDESQLAFATSVDRVLITFNVAHFAKLHADWLQQSRQHAGIIVSSQRPVGVTLRRLLKKRTLANLYNQRPTWLDNAHRKLDEAVFAAYGWNAEMTDEELLAKLLEVNLQRAGDYR